MKSRPILVTGAAGQLGSDVILELKKRDLPYIATDLENEAALHLYGKDKNFIPCDLCDEAAVDSLISNLQPAAIIHCAAWTNVDGAEEPSVYDTVYAVNVLATQNLAKEAKKADIPMLLVSTDYVFDGKGETPWAPENTNYAPLSVYGKTKRMAEEVVEGLDKYFIVRTAWVFGLRGNNFVKTMVNLSKKYEQIRVVNDQIGCCTYTKDLARLLADLIESDKYGTYHATNSGGFISWYDLSCEIMSQIGASTKVEGVSTEEYGLSKANRPKNSRLSLEKLSENGFEQLPDWKDAVARYLEEMGKE
jgi:dTDP-4-dehydrorhamnose reductase